MFNHIDPRLAHLTNDQIEELVCRYYDGENTKALILEYKVDCVESQLYKLFPPLTLHQMPCPHCAIPMVRERRSRSSSRFSRSNIHCPNCRHVDDAHCKCENCAQKLRQAMLCEQEEKRKKIAELCKDRQSDPATISSLNELSMRQAVSLLSLVRTCMYMEIPETEKLEEENEIHLNALTQSMVPFTPTKGLGISLVRDLMDCGLVSFSKHSDPNAFAFKDGELDGFHLELVSWKIAVDNPQNLIRDIEHHAANADLWPKSWEDEIEGLWIDIAFSEAKEFFLYMAMERGLPDASGKALDELLFNLLQEFSVAQCYRVIYAGSKEAADFLVRKKCNKRHAANYMIGACQRWVDRARAEKWEVPRYKRNFDLPRSMISYVFFDTFMKLGETGFNDNPKSILFSIQKRL